MMENKFTYIIGYRHSDERYKNLSRTLEWLNNFPDSEIIIVEQDITQKLSLSNDKIKHIFVYNNSAYNRSWAFNIASKLASTEKICFGDSDLVMNVSHFLESLSELENFDVVSPYKVVLDLYEVESEFPLSQMENIQRPGRGETDNQKINLCGGIVLFRKDAITKIGGWNEDFIGWGGEDDFQTLKVNLFGLKSKEMPYKCYHLYHERPAPDMNLYRRNLDLLNRAFNVKIEDLRTYITNSMIYIGNENKFKR